MAKESLSRPSNPQVLAHYAQLPLSFEPNRGQTDRNVKFLSRGRGYTLFLARRGEAVLVLRKSVPRRSALRPAALSSSTITADSEAMGPPAVVRMKLLGGKTTPQVEGLDELPGKANYFVGNDPKKWRTNVPTYGKVLYRDVYPGVDLVYYGNRRQLEHDFIVAPGADPRSITLNFAGAEKVSLDTQGHLVLGVKEGEVQFEKPSIYQEVGGVRQEISGSYLFKGTHQVGFQVAAYDTNRPLVIDPVLFYSTYLGGSGSDQGQGIAVDSSGNAYVTGATGSSNLPTVTGAFQSALRGGSDVFVTKLNPTGSALIYSTYVGGSNGEFGAGITVGSSGNAYVTGATSSSDFPTTLGAFQTIFTAPAGADNAFVMELNPSGSALVYSTYLGGNGDDRGFGIAIDASGDAYVAGGTSSTNFPTTPGAFQTTCRAQRCTPFTGTGAGFVTKLNPSGTALVYSTYLSGSNGDVNVGES